MADANHPAYYAARAETARKLAARARDHSIKKIHEQMAGDYEMMAAKAQAPELRWVSAA